MCDPALPRRALPHMSSKCQDLYQFIWELDNLRVFSAEILSLFGLTAGLVDLCITVSPESFARLNGYPPKSSYQNSVNL
jgi:hypothetical protein